MDYISQEGNLGLNSKIITETIKVFEGYLLYGEKDDYRIIEIFFEYNFLNILKIFSFETKGNIIIEQIIKTFTALIKKITRETVFYYIMSNDFINNIISRSFIFLKFDKNFLPLYIDFLETLSTKLNINTVQFLFQEEKGCFPLLDEAIKLYNHPDYNIRKISKNIILNIIKIDYKPLNKYFSSLPTISYFCFLACQLKDEIIFLSNEIEKNKNNINNNNKIKTIIKDIKNNLIHIQNIFNIGCIIINYILINSLFYYCIIPYILYNLNFNKEEICKSGKKIKKTVCIFVINLFFIYIKNDIFVNILFTLIFFQYNSKTINYYMKNNPIQPLNYCYTWNKSLKSTSKSFLNFIQFNFNSCFLKSILFMNKSQYTEIQQIYNKYQKKLNNELNFDFEKNKDQLLIEIIKEVLNKLSFSEISIMSSYHSYLSGATGINCGLNIKNGDLCIMQKMKNFYENYFNEKEITNDNLIPNHIKNNLFEILIKKKSNKKIILINILLKNIFFENKNISKILFKEINLIPGNLLDDKEINQIIKKSKNNEISFQNKNGNLEQKIIKNNETSDKNININYIKENKNNKYFNIINKNNNENFVPNIQNKEYDKNDISKNFRILDTKISLNGFIKNSGFSIAKQTKRIINIDNNCPEDEQKTSIEDYRYLFLDNDYFNNLRKELSSKSYFYNEKLIDILISLIDENNNLDIISLKMIIDNILLLVTKDNQNFISLYHNNKLFLIYEKYKEEIKCNYNNKKTFHNNAYQLFIKNHQNYLFISNLDLVKFIIKDENMLISNTFEEELLFKNNININPDNKYDKLIISFLLIHDLYYNLLSLHNHSSCTNQKGYNNFHDFLYINNFPLLNRMIPLKINKQYFLIDLEPDIQYYECKCKMIMNKTDNENFFDAHLLIFDSFILIGDSSIDNSYTIIKYIFLISSCSIQIDNYNNKNINIYINNNIYNNNIEICLDFKNYNISNFITNLLQKEIKKAVFFEKDKIRGFIQNL